MLTILTIHMKISKLSSRNQPYRKNSYKSSSGTQRKAQRYFER
jgi:hypothetical protein